MATHTTPWEHEGREYEVRWVQSRFGDDTFADVIDVIDAETGARRPDLCAAASFDDDLSGAIDLEVIRLEDAAREDAEERRAEQRRDERRGL